MSVKAYSLQRITSGFGNSRGVSITVSAGQNGSLNRLGERFDAEVGGDIIRDSKRCLEC